MSKKSSRHLNEKISKSSVGVVDIVKDIKSLNRYSVSKGIALKILKKVK